MTGVIYLQCHNEFDKVAKLGTITGDLEILSKRDAEEARSSTKVGWYSHVDGKVVCLCRLDGLPWLRIDDFAIQVGDDMRVSWDLFGIPKREGPPAPESEWKPGRVMVNPAARARFLVERAGTVILSFEHRPFQDRPIFAGDLTPFVTEEDYDFMLFISRVLEDPGRRARFFQPKAG